MALIAVVLAMVALICGILAGFGLDGRLLYVGFCLLCLAFLLYVLPASGLLHLGR